MIAQPLESHLWNLFESGVFDEGEHQVRLLARVNDLRLSGLGRRPEDEGPTLSPSRVKMAHPENCERQLALSRDGAKKNPLHPGQVLMFENGHQIHALFLAALAEFPPTWAERIEVEKFVARDLPNPNGEEPIKMRGFVDLLILHRLDLKEPEWEIVDLKTVRGAAFRYGEKDWPKPLDALQLKLYRWIMGAELDGHKISGGSILYIDREGQNFTRGRDVGLSSGVEEVRRILGRAADISTSEEMPDVLQPVLKKGVASLPWQCAYCPWYGESCPGAAIE